MDMSTDLDAPLYQGISGLLTTPHYGPVRGALAKAIHWHYTLFQKKRHEDVVLERICGLSLLVTPGVLNPRLVRSGQFFASQLAAQPAVQRDPDLVAPDAALVARNAPHLAPVAAPGARNAALLPPNAEVLDMGTGSGVCALAAARSAKRVVAVDIHREAVRCATLNVLLNRCEDRIEVLLGDLFAPVAGRHFDVVLFNPPFVRGLPRDDADRAWRSTDVAERFAAQLRDHLRPGGCALVLLSTYGDPAHFIAEFRRHRFKAAVVAERRFFNETLAIVRLT